LGAAENGRHVNSKVKRQVRRKVARSSVGVSSAVGRRWHRHRCFVVVAIGRWYRHRCCGIIVG
jgi:hypothetical protein